MAALNASTSLSTLNLTARTSLFTDNEVQLLTAHYGGVQAFIDVLTSPEGPAAAPVEVINHLISRVIVYHFHGWFPEDNSGSAGPRARWVEELLVTQFGVVDNQRSKRIYDMVQAYRLNYQTMAMDGAIGGGLGVLSIALPKVKFQIIPATVNHDPQLTAKVEVVPLTFTGAGKVGDFGWMITQPEYQSDLFIFNDNEESNEQYRSRIMDNNTDVINQNGACLAGGGNAIIRPYRCLHGRKDRPQSAGLPTGFRPINEFNMRGYQSLDEASKGATWAMNYITSLVKSGQYHRVYFSVDDKGILGQGIFAIDPQVRVYFTNFLLNLANV